MGGVSHLSMSMLNLNFKILVETLVGDTGGVNHLSISRLNLKYKILSEILVGYGGGVDHSWHLSFIQICDFLLALGFT